MTHPMKNGHYGGVYFFTGPNLSALARLAKAWRERHGLTTYEAAGAAGITQPQWIGIEGDEIPTWIANATSSPVPAVVDLILKVSPPCSKGRPADGTQEAHNREAKSRSSEQGLRSGHEGRP